MNDSKTKYPAFEQLKQIHNGYSAYGVGCDEEAALIKEFNQLLAENQRYKAVLLLAARWFKINLDDNQLPAVPPSKQDLMSMLKNCQQALKGEVGVE